MKLGKHSRRKTRRPPGARLKIHFADVATFEVFVTRGLSQVNRKRDPTSTRTAVALTD